VALICHSQHREKGAFMRGGQVPVKWAVFSGIMMQTQQPAAPPAPTFIRTLARVAGLQVNADGEGLLEPVAQWLDWNRAVALSRVLDAPMAAGWVADPEAELASTDTALPVHGQEADRLRWALRREIEEDAVWQALVPATEAQGEAGFASLRAHYIALQRKMLAACGRLRGDLREQVLRAAPAQAQLVALDELMEGMLSPRESALLAAIPALLSKRYAHLQAEAASAWQQAFHAEVRGLLLAELELRFLPIAALQAALRGAAL
jgi:hypothetical protein